MHTGFQLVSYSEPSFFVLDLAIKSTLILVVALVMTRLLRRASAAVRYSVWSVAILSVLALPIINLCLPKWTLETGAVSQVANSQSFAPSSATLPVSKTQYTSQKDVSESTLPSEPAFQAALLNTDKISVSLPTLITNAVMTLNVVWLIGSGVMLIRLLIMRVQLWSASRSYETVTAGRLFELLQICHDELGSSKPVSLFVADQRIMPMTWGIFRPSILLPREAENWPEQEVRCAFLHELAHVSRLDCLSQLFVQLACVLYWLNPLVWVAARSLHVEREVACDDIVLQNGERASEYAAQLMQAVSHFQSNRMLESTAVSMAGRNGFARRLQAILQETQDRRPVSRGTMMIFVSAFLGLTSLLGFLQIGFTETAYAQQTSPVQQPDQPQFQREPVKQQLPALPILQQKKQGELKPIQGGSPPSILKKGKHSKRTSRINRPAVRSLNIVFAHDPGIGNYDGIVGRPNDVWNTVDIGTTAVDYTRFSDASPSTARLRISRHDGEWGIEGQSGIFQGYIYHNCRCVDLETKVLDLPAGRYKIYVFAHGDAPNQNAEIELKVGHRVIGKKATANDGTWDFRTKPYREGLQFVSFNFKMKAGQELTLISHRAGSVYSMFNAIQIVPLTDSAMKQLKKPASKTR